MSGHVPTRQRRSALTAQLSVIHALVLREMQLRFGESKLGYLWLVGEPLLLAFGISAVHWVTGHDIGDIPVFLFYALGYSPFFMFRAIVNRNATAVTGSSNLLFHQNIKVNDLTISRTVMEAAACITVVMLIVCFAIFIDGAWPAHPGLFVLGLLLSAIVSHGFSSLLAALVVFYEPLERMIHPLTYLMMPFSGAFLMMSSVTPEYRQILLWNPMVHVHEAIRHAQWGDRLVSYYDISYVLLWALILNLLGIAALRAARPYVTLSH